MNENCRGLSRRECAEWLVHDAAGRQWAREREGTMSMAAMVAELFNRSAHSAAQINAQRKASTMSNTETILKKARALGEHGVTAMIQKYANSVKLPGETSAQAFTRVFLEDSGEGRAMRTIHAISKGVDERPLPEPDDEGDDDNALAELESWPRRSAAAIRSCRRRPASRRCSPIRPTLRWRGASARPARASSAWCCGSGFSGVSLAHMRANKRR
jgi:hypothetical protein